MTKVPSKPKKQSASDLVANLLQRRKQLSQKAKRRSTYEFVGIAG
ncbi:MAG: hypothetical protein P8I38_02705 [Arenicella sp.]|jgi:hypothetical protein|nr:hypothetical protein [Arenicella sp.]